MLWAEYFSKRPAYCLVPLRDAEDWTCLLPFSKPNTGRPQIIESCTADSATWILSPYLMTRPPPPPPRWVYSRSWKPNCTKTSSWVTVTSVDHRLKARQPPIYLIRCLRVSTGASGGIHSPSPETGQTRPGWRGCAKFIAGNRGLVVAPSLSEQ